MRRAFAIAVLLVATFGRADENNTDPKKADLQPDPDLKKLQGKWRLAYHELAGHEDSENILWELEVKDDQYTLTADGTTTNGTIRLNSSKKPKQLEYTAENDDDTMATFVGIYEIDGDTYKTCDVEKGKDAVPTEFKTKAKTGQVAVWKKVKIKD